MSDLDLEGAYALSSTDDTKRLYADWAETYDSDFAADMDFVMPQKIAQAFAEAGGNGPVLDFGAGTGLVGRHLAPLMRGPIDALDLSPQMLAVAGRKAVYRRLIEGNLLAGYALDPVYNGVISSGTFTHGHVGPEALQPLLDVAMPGALFALSIKVQHFDEAGFAAEFERLSDQIMDLQLPRTRLYGNAAKTEHRDAIGYIALFKKR